MDSRIERTKVDIASGLYQKIVLSRLKRLILSDEPDLGSLVKQLAQIEENSFLFTYAEPSGRAYIGRSPERLLSWADKSVSVDAIAGTRKRCESLVGDRETEDELQSSLKDIVNTAMSLSLLKTLWIILARASIAK